ncbi:MAG: sulfatase [Caldilineales bacterium]|nr:sulfatase [Caldilineales bacterium]
MRPNVVLVMADDLDVLLGSLEAMPRLQALLVDQGMTFANAFVPLPLCCPARASLWRGQYPHNHGVRTNLPPTGGFATALANGMEQATLATALQAAGYRTALIGKYLNGYPLPEDPTYVPPGWDRWFVPVTNSAYASYNYTVNDDRTLRSYGADPQDYITDVLAAEAVAFIGETAGLSPRPPFFLALMFYAPHTPAVPAPRHAALFPDARVPRTAAFNEADISDKPPFMQALPPLTPAEIEEMDALHRKRLRSLQAVDEALQRIVEALAATGQVHNTYIFFTSDNGYHMGQHRLSPGKGMPYEEDIRVPLLVRGPGVPAGVVRQELVSLVDLAPTVAAISGASLAVPYDGRSLLPLLHSAEPAAKWRQAIFVEHFRPPPTAASTPNDRSSEPPDPFDRQMAQRQDLTPDWVLLRTASYVVIERAGGAYEVYDLINDPFQLRNLAARVHPAFLAQASDWLAAFKACSGWTCRSAEMRRAPALRLQLYLPLTTRG